MKYTRWLLLSLAMGSLALAAPARRANPGLPAPVMPWNIPADPVAVPRPSLERLDAAGMPLRIRVEPQARSMSATLMARTPPLTGAGRLALSYALRYGGTKSLEGPVFGALLGQLGMAMSVEVYPDQLELTLRGPAQVMRLGENEVGLLDLLAQRVRTPAFSEALLTQTREALQEIIGKRRSDPLLAGLDQLRSLLFQQHPYALSLGPADAEGLDLKILESLHTGTFVPSRCLLVVTGPLDGAGVKALTEKAFAGWEGAAATERPPLPRPQESSSVQTLPSPDARMVALAGRIVVPANPMERAATRVLATALEAALQRSVPEPGNFRVGARLEEQGDASMLWGWVEGANPGSTDAILRQEILRLGQGGLQPREIEYARARAIAELMRGMTLTEGLVRGNARLDLLHGPQPPDAGIAAELEMLKTLPPTAVVDMGRALLGRTAVAIVVVAPEGIKLGAAPMLEPTVLPGGAPAAVQAAAVGAAAAGGAAVGGAAVGGAGAEKKLEPGANEGSRAGGAAQNAPATEPRAAAAPAEAPQVRKSRGGKQRRVARRARTHRRRH